MIEENNNEINMENTDENVDKIPNTEKDPYEYIPESYRKKREIRRLAAIVGIPTICISAITYLWSFAYIFLTTSVAGMTVSEAIKLSEDPAMQQILQIILSCLMFLLPFSVAAKCAGVRIDKTIQFSKAKKGTFLPFLFFGVGFCSFSNIAMSYAESIFQGFGIDYEFDFGDNPTGVFGFILSFIATAIVPALVEEFACRGIVLGLLKKHGEGFAIVTSSIIFGVMHGNFEQIPFAVFVGLILGYVYVKTNSIWPCVAVHGINNAVSVIFNYLENSLTVELQNVLYIVYLIATLIIAVIGVLLFAKSDEDYALEKKEDTITEKAKYISFFTSWVMILFIAINFVNAMKYFDFTSLFYDLLEHAGV